MKLTLTVDTMSVIKWWVDALQHTHMDCWRHTGAMITLGKGATSNHSGKHKLNTKRTNKSDITLHCYHIDVGTHILVL